MRNSSRQNSCPKILQRRKLAAAWSNWFIFLFKNWRECLIGQLGTYDINNPRLANIKKLECRRKHFCPSGCYLLHVPRRRNRTSDQGKISKTTGIEEQDRKNWKAENRSQSFGDEGLLSPNIRKSSVCVFVFSSLPGARRGVLCGVGTLTDNFSKTGAKRDFLRPCALCARRGRTIAQYKMTPLLWDVELTPWVYLPICMVVISFKSALFYRVKQHVVIVATKVITIITIVIIVIISKHLTTHHQDPVTTRAVSTKSCWSRISRWYILTPVINGAVVGISCHVTPRAASPILISQIPGFLQVLVTYKTIWYVFATLPFSIYLLLPLQLQSTSYSLYP